MKAKEEVVNQKTSSPNTKPLERFFIYGAEEENVDGNGGRGQPRHQRHPPHLRIASMRNEEINPRSCQEPYRNRYTVGNPPVVAQTPVSSRGYRRREDEEDEEDELEAVAGRSDPSDVVAAHEESNCHEHEDEERGDGEQVGQNVKLCEQGNDRSGCHHCSRGVHGSPSLGIHVGEPRRHHVGSRNLRSKNEIMVNTCNRDLDGELCIAEDREQSRDTGDDVGEDNGGSSIITRLQSGENEDSGADDGAHAEPYEIPPRESLLHVVVAPGLGGQLCLVVGARENPVRQPRRSLFQRIHVVSPAPERFLGEKIVLCA
nr:Os12g0613150 [Ipomoea batatas]